MDVLKTLLDLVNCRPESEISDENKLQKVLDILVIVNFVHLVW